MLLKRAEPDRHVVVFERNGPDDTFGFGVVFSDATLAGIHDADPVLLTALTEHGVHWETIEVRLRGERHRCGGNGMAAVERRTLLHLLQQRAADQGVELCFRNDVGVDDVLDAGFELIVVADGANSRLRDAFTDEFQPTFDTASARFIWLGTTYPYEGLTFVHERSPHGVFAAHAYPIGNGVSTFIVETDAMAWRGAGLDEFDVTGPAGPSDERSRDYLLTLFAEQLDGHRLLVNNSRWAAFRTRAAARWTHRVGGAGLVLLGDAAHTAHFSVGSGTKMAMEDAIALAAALEQLPHDVDGALGVYEDIRRPQVAKIQAAARQGLSWWETFGRTYDALAPWQFAYHFFTRSLDDSKLRRRDPAFVDRSHACWAAEHGAEPIASSFDLAGDRLPSRLVAVDESSVRLTTTSLSLREQPPPDRPWALRVEAPVDPDDLGQARALVARGAAAGASLVAVHGGTPLHRRLITEEARLGHATPALLVEDADDDVATTAILSGRTDLVARPSTSSS
jgi:anthraniloyl-CoA monooxygenase